MLNDTPQPRMVFFVKHIVAALQDRIYSQQTTVEIMQVLTQTLVNIKDVYGSFWTDLFDIIMSIWSWQPDILSAQLPTVYSSMQLFCTLRKLSLEGSNDDLQDVYNERKEQIFDSLLGLLKHQSGETQIVLVGSGLPWQRRRGRQELPASRDFQHTPCNCYEWIGTAIRNRCTRPLPNTGKRVSCPATGGLPTIKENHP